MKGKLKLKKGDKIVVVAGKSKGTVGEILKIFPRESRALVRGVNIVKGILSQHKILLEELLKRRIQLMFLI